MKFDKKTIEKIVQNDDYKKACRAEALAYLCYSIGNQAREQADEFLSKVGLKVYDIKMFSNKAMSSFQQYHNCVKDTILKDLSMELCEDYEKLRHELYVFAGLEDKNNGAPSCSAENNDNIEFVHNAEGGKE